MMDYEHSIPEFSLRNSGLPFLAAAAAIDIEGHIQNRDKECESVEYLSKLLEGITSGENPQVKLTDNLIVLGYAIFGRKKFEDYWKGKRTDEVLLQINLVAKDLRDFKSLPEDKQRELSDFCVELSTETAYHHSQYYSGFSGFAA